MNEANVPVKAGDMTSLEQEVTKIATKLNALNVFGRLHRDFLLKMEGGYFVNDRLDALVFFEDRRNDVRTYFGADGWRLCAMAGALEKKSDGLTVRLILPHDNGFFSDEITI